MATRTAIEWTEVTWNPATGCDRVSPGCDNCYALTLAKRLKAMGAAKYQTDGDPRTSGPGFGVAVHADALTLPLKWRSSSSSGAAARPKRVAEPWTAGPGTGCRCHAVAGPAGTGD